MRSRRSSGAVDESKQTPPPNDSNVSRNSSRKSSNHPSSQLSFFGFRDRRNTVPLVGGSCLDVARPFSTEEAPSPPVPPPPTETEPSQDQKTTLRRSFSLFRRKTSSQMNSPVPVTPKSAKSPWRRFRSSSKTSVQGPANSNEVIEYPPRHFNRVAPRPTRPIPPVPQESPPTSESGEPNESTNTLRRHNRSASLQEAHMPLAEPPPSIGWNTPNPVTRGGASLDMNHFIGSVETSTRSSHNLLFGTDERRERLPTVRDLAILPTQRVMRYVLFFKGSQHLSFPQIRRIFTQYGFSSSRSFGPHPGRRSHSTPDCPSPR